MAFPSLPRRWRRATLLVSIPVVAACHRIEEEAEPAASPSDSTTAIPLEIANHNWLDVTIFVVRDGQASRVGIASASSASSFVLPGRMIGQGGEIRLWGRPIGGSEGTLSEVVVVQPGQWIEWTLESDLD
jgi:hypothetical protein